jgi:hypothetical protein
VGVGRFVYWRVLFAFLDHPMEPIFKQVIPPTKIYLSIKVRDANANLEPQLSPKHTHALMYPVKYLHASVHSEIHTQTPTHSHTVHTITTTKAVAATIYTHTYTKHTNASSPER